MNVDTWATKVVGGLLPALRDSFALDPFGAVDALGLTVLPVQRLSSRRGDGGACDGVSYLDDDIVLYAPSPNSRRENFTLGHELGHWLINHQAELLNWLADQRDPMAQLETVCDRIAQQLLVPIDAINAIIGDGPVTAQHVLDLYAATNASRPVCAIAVASRLRAMGAVAIIDTATFEIDFVSVHPDPDRGWPAVFPWTRHGVQPGHPLRVLKPGSSTRRQSFWAAPWGSRADYYIDALHDGRRVIAVFADTDLWGVSRLHIEPDREYLSAPTGEVTCCGATRRVRGYPCPTCGGHYCPTCGRCRCEKLAASDTQCRNCHLTFRPHLLVDGLCEDCR